MIQVVCILLCITVLIHLWINLDGYISEEAYQGASLLIFTLTLAAAILAVIKTVIG